MVEDKGMLAEDGSWHSGACINCYIYEILTESLYSEWDLAMTVISHFSIVE